jgi:hypothetical protein
MEEKPRRPVPKNLFKRKRHADVHAPVLLSDRICVLDLQKLYFSHAKICYNKNNTVLQTHEKKVQQL